MLSGGALIDSYWSYMLFMQNAPHFSLSFTLVELLITLAIAAILLGLSIPSFTALISSNRLSSSANKWITTLNYARSEAIKRNQQVVVRKTSTNWEQGWQVFVDIDRSTVARQNVLDSDDILLRDYAALPVGFTLRGNQNFSNFIRYKPNGVSSSFGSFVICDNRDGNNLPEPDTSKLLTVNAAGRVHLGIDANINGIPERDDGSEIVSCTVSPF